MSSNPSRANRKPKIGILVANLGTPDGHDYWSMRRYLNEFLSDRRVVDLPRWKWLPILKLIILSIRPFTSGANYRMIWNNELDESPLLTFTRSQTDKLRAILTEAYGDEVMVEFAMRYGNPSTQSKVREMVEAGCRKILFFPLYPHYAGSTSGTANDQFFRALMEETRQPAARIVPEYYDRPDYIEALAKSVERLYPTETDAPERLICSYHGMPRRYVKNGDPYYCQCRKTTRLLRERLGWSEDRIVTTFQSVFGREEWIKPYTVEEVARLAKDEGVRNIAVMAPAFSSDCIETLEEIQGEICESFEEAGGESFTYIPCLNDDDEHVAMLAQVAKENLRGWLD